MHELKARLKNRCEQLSGEVSDRELPKIKNEMEYVLLYVLALCAHE